MRILVVSQYFWPEQFRINDFCEGLMQRGHEVVVVTGIPNYPDGKFFLGYSLRKPKVEWYKGIKIYRSRLFARRNGRSYNLMLNYLSFAFWGSLKVFGIQEQKFDRIFVFEPSPVTVGIPAIVASKRFRAPIIFWVQDLWPQSVTAASGLKNKVVISALEQLTRYIYANCRYLAVQSRAFIPYIVGQKVDPAKIVYLPNSTEDLYQVKQPQEKYERLMPQGFRLMFAGNIGAAQSFDTLVAAARLLKDRQVAAQWVILGDGRMRPAVEQMIRDHDLSDCFQLLGSFPAQEMPDFFASADALMVSLKRDPIFAMTIPSKVQSYLACGKPIIASLDGEGARIVKEADSGFASPAEDAPALAANIERMVNLSAAERAAMGHNSRKYYEAHFDREMLLDRFEKLLQ